MKKMDISWILDQCAIMIVDEGMSLVDCLERYPDEWDEILPLLYTARRLQAVSNITASADLRQGGLATLRAHAAAHPHPKATVMTDISRRGEKTHQGRFSWNVALVSFLLVVILLVGGANVAAAAALPGNWLYPLKLAQETARVWIVPDESERLRLRLAWADRRLEEAQTRLDQGRSHDTQQALQGYVHLMETSLKEISGEPGGATQSQVNQWMLQELERQRLQLIQIQEVAGPLASMHEVLYASQQIQERVEYQVRQQLHETPQQPASTTTNP